MNKDKLVLILLEGFGISPSFSGNAILAANPKNFFELWQRYNHVLIDPIYKTQNENSLFESQNTEFATILSGKNILSDQGYIDSLIHNKKFYLNPKLNSVFDDITSRNSALHLIGNLSDQTGRYGNIDHLLALLLLAKRRRIFRVYVHLILDDSISDDPRDTLALVAFLIKKMNELNVGEIASITGEQFIKNANFANFNAAFRAIALGAGKTALSAEQAITLGSGSVEKNSSLPPSVITFRGQAIGKINNFDSVIFFNHDNSNLQRLILALSKEISTSDNLKFINVAAFYDSFLQKPEKLKIIFERDFSKNLPEILSSNGLRQYYISDESRQDLLQKFQGDAKSIKNDFISVPNKSYLEKYDFDAILSNVKENSDCNFMMVDVPYLYQTSLDYSFEKNKEAVKRLDDFLAKLVKLTVSLGFSCIVTSNHGSAEQMFQKNQYEKLNKKTSNPLPFVLISAKSASGKSISSNITNTIMYDMLKEKRDLPDIAPTILRLLGINKADEMTGESFVTKLVNVK